VNRILLPSTDLVCSVVGLGTWGLGGSNEIDGTSLGWPQAKTPHRIVETALQLGINFFDCSDFYGQGKSETLLGEVLNGVPNIIVTTKVGLLPRFRPGTRDLERDFSAAHIERALADSLLRLRRDKVDLLYLHGPGNDVLERRQTWRMLQQLKDAGLVRHIGVSLGRSESVGAALDRWLAMPLVSVVQLEYSLRFPSRARDVDLVDRHDKAIIARSVLNHGLLIRDPRAPRTIEECDHRRHKWKEESRGPLVSFVDAYKNTGASKRSKLEGAVRYVIDSANIAAAVVGVSTPDQLKSVVAACGAPPMSLDERAVIHGIAATAFRGD
jgi:aryl-alcohol dehydrogenase-like predicted oxidoreductase